MALRPSLLVLAALAFAGACKPRPTPDAPPADQAALPPGFPNLEGTHGPKIMPPVPKPDFTLTDTDGKPYNFRERTEGKITLLFLGYTNCPDVCPVHLANIAAALQKLGPEIPQKLEVVFVTTDPARDTPQAIRKWLDNFDKRFVGLTGDSASVVALQNQLRMGVAFREPGKTPDSYTVAHSSMVLAFTRDNLAHIVYPFGIRQADWVNDLPLLVKS